VIASCLLASFTDLPWLKAISASRSLWMINRYGVALPAAPFRQTSAPLPEGPSIV